MLGYSSNELPSTGATWLSLLHPDEKESVMAGLTDHLEGRTQEHRAQLRMRCKDGSWRWILTIGRVVDRDADGKPRRVSGVHLDETNRKQMEAQLAQAQRLEAIGQLTAGVAHEINSPMQFVVDNVEYLAEGIHQAAQVIKGLESQLAAPLADHAERRIAIDRLLKETRFDQFQNQADAAIEDCREGCQRVVSIVRAMRQLSHPGSEKFEQADLQEIIRGATTVTRNTWRYVADLNVEAEKDLPMIDCRPSELSQVFVNLIVNASDAIAESLEVEPERAKQIHIRTEKVAEVLRVRLSDSGCGMSPEVSQRVFEPFFTTKAVGKGTGQGLAIAYSIIVQKHRGSLRVDSQLGIGTTFVIDLPIRQTAIAPIEALTTAQFWDSILIG
jgi:PAS domain S-box-containing protein